MKLFVVTRNEPLQKSIHRATISLGYGTVSGDSTQANVLVCDRWIYPYHHDKVYLYTLFALEGMLNQAIITHLPDEFPAPLEGFDNAFYVGINILNALCSLAEKEFLYEEDDTRYVMVVDDHPENVEGLSEIPNMIYIDQFNKAIDLIQVGTIKLSCVLTDLLMPVKSSELKYQNIKDIQPTGILVCFAAIKRGIPCVIVTGGHNMSPLEEYFRTYFTLHENIPIIECSIRKKSEYWLRGYQEAMKIVLAR